MVLTRSQTRQIIKTLEFTDFDFDGASKAWLANKIKLGNGTYKYNSTVIPLDTNRRYFTRTMGKM